MKRRDFIEKVSGLILSSFFSKKSLSEINSYNVLDNESTYYSNAYTYINDISGDDTGKLQKVIMDNKIILIPKQSERTKIKSNIIIPSNRVLIINNDIEQVTDQNDIWTLSNIISKYPMFRIKSGSKNIVIIGKGNLYSIYEGIAVIGTIKNPVSHINIKMSVIGNILDDKGERYSKFGGLSFYSANFIDASGSSVINCGIKSRWNGKKRVGGGANGFGFYNCKNVKLTSSKTFKCGGSGVFTNACDSIFFKDQENIYNGLSGIQIGAHPGASGGVISSNKNAYNTADGIDIRWVGEGIASINLFISNNMHYKNGFYFGDLTKPTQDGSGIVTLASVKNVKLFNNISIDSAGSWLYMESCSNVYGFNNKGTVYTNKEGVFFTGKFCDNIKLIMNNVETKGSSLSFAGNAVFSDLNISGIFISKGGRAVSMGESSKYIRNTVNAHFLSDKDIYLMGGNWDKSQFSLNKNSKLYTNKNVLGINTNAVNKIN